MGIFALERNAIVDLTSQITKLGSPITSGSFGEVYRCTINKGKTEVAVKVFVNDPNKAMAKVEKAMLRELRVWLRLSDSINIVPLLGIARVGSISPLPALVSKWMPSGTLYVYLDKTTLPASAKVKLVKGVAEGLNDLHSQNVVHGDLHPGNVLIDGSGNPCLTDFGLATVVGDSELQLTTTTAAGNFNSRWRAPEVIGIDCDPGRPNFKSDIYSFGGVMFFIFSGDIPWPEKKYSHQITVELSRRTIPTRPENVLNDTWSLIQRCWSWEPGHRPGTPEVLQDINQFKIDASQTPISKLPANLTGQIFSTNNDYHAGGAFANVYKCEWRRQAGPIKVAVKSIRIPISELDLNRYRDEVETWAILAHENIVLLLGTTDGFGPYTALVFPWFSDGTLLHLIADQGARLNIRSRLNLLHGTASGLEYLHRSGIIHGDITSSNILVDFKEGEYQACLTDIGLATVLGGRLGNRVIEGSNVRSGAIRWIAPELLTAGGSPTMQNDMYSFGRVMFHAFALVIPWHDVHYDFSVLQRILNGDVISRPVTSDAIDITDARWNEIEKCWSAAGSRPSALKTMAFLKTELEILTDDDTTVHAAEENHRPRSLNAITLHPSSTILTPSPLGPFNVILFGEPRVGKSSIINLIMGQDVANTSSDAPRSVLEHTTYEVNIRGRRFKLWEVSSIAAMGLLRRRLAKWRQKKSYRKLYANSGVHLLLYCIRGPAVPASIKDYRYFTDVVGFASRIPIAAVVNGLDNSSTNMDVWWTEHDGDLERLGMRFSKHICITSLPDDPSASPDMQQCRLRSQKTIRSLIYES